MDDKLLKDAQYRKGLSIGYFNSLNASIELAKVMFPDMEAVDAKAFIREWRDHFLQEYKDYYANVIAKVGSNYNAEETIKRLQEAKSMDELKAIWLSISEDERHDKAVQAVKDLKKKEYEDA